MAAKLICCSVSGAAAGVRRWPARRWQVALAGAVVVGLLLAVPTALLPTPWFGRTIAPTWWSGPMLIATAGLSGLVLATYVDRPVIEVGSGRASGAAGLLSFFAVGCPVCNKLVLLAFGFVGAVDVFAPLQPLLALTAIALLLWALRRRLQGERSCPASFSSSSALLARPMVHSEDGTDAGQPALGRTAGHLRDGLR